MKTIVRVRIPPVKVESEADVRVPGLYEITSKGQFQLYVWDEQRNCLKLHGWLTTDSYPNEQKCFTFLRQWMTDVPANDPRVSVEVIDGDGDAD